LVGVAGIDRQCLADKAMSFHRQTFDRQNACLTDYSRNLILSTDIC
jgi:hypothetical protein